MWSLLEFLKPICVCGKRKKKEFKNRQERPLRKGEKKEKLLKNDQLTLRDCILSSPRSSPLPQPGTSNKRVYPNPSTFNNNDVSLDIPLSEVRLDARLKEVKDDDDNGMETKMEDESMSRGGRTKKRVSFRRPEVAEVFILDASPEQLTDTSSYHPRKHRLSSNVTDVNQDLLSKRRTTCAENVSSPNNHLHSTVDPSIPPTDTSVNHAHHTGFVK
nr:hypothetical protein [Tanacetum cinerariifolium]